MSPLQLIKQGIEAGDWGAVVKGYNTLTGELVAVPNTQEPNTFHQSCSVVANYLLSLSEHGESNMRVMQYDDTDSLYKQDDMVGIDDNPPDPRFPTSHLIDPVVQEQMRQISQQHPRDTRLPYNPHNTKCPSCQKEFDGNKNIKKHVFGNPGQSSIVYKCPSCKAEV